MTKSTVQHTHRRPGLALLSVRTAVGALYDVKAIDEVPGVVAKTPVVSTGRQTIFSMRERGLGGADDEDEANERSGEFHGIKGKNDREVIPELKVDVEDEKRAVLATLLGSSTPIKGEDQQF